MGNLCSKGNKSSSDDPTPNARPAQPENSNHFQGSGRTLSSATPKPPPATIPSRTRPIDEEEQEADMGNEQSKGKASGAGKSTGGGRALGSGPAQAAGGNDPRSAAAKAAEARQNSNAAPAGKLGKQLAAQKRSTGVAGGALQEASRETRGQRNADEAKEAREYN